MMDLPQSIGPLTLLRAIGAGGPIDTYEAVLADEGQRRVFVRHVVSDLGRDRMAQAAIETRVQDLTGTRHPFLVSVLDMVREDGELFVVEEWVEGISLSDVVHGCRERGVHVPCNVYLNVATQICNALEALHGRPGRGTGLAHVLHLALRPSHVFLTPDGKVLLGGYGLQRAPRIAGEGGEEATDLGLEYLSPEQTHADQKLTPASDVFSLGSTLHEFLTLEPLFRGDTPLDTIQRVRRAEVTTPLQDVKDLLPGLEKVLHRALSPSPRHRYQRAFVLREDLRGLMAGYEFSSITGDTAAFLATLLGGEIETGPGPASRASEPGTVGSDPLTTAAFAARALTERSPAEAGWTEPDAGVPVVIASGLTPDADFPMPQVAPAVEVEAVPEEIPSPVAPGPDALDEGQVPAPVPLPVTPPRVDPGLELAPSPTGPTEPMAAETPLDLTEPPARRAPGLLVLVGIVGILVLAGAVYAVFTLLAPPQPITAEAPAPAVLPPPAEAPPMEPAAAEPERATVARAAPPRAPEAGRPVPAPVRPSPQPAPATPFVAPEGDAVADLGAPEPPDSLALLDRYAAAATSGRLTASDIMVMEMIQADDRGYDRSRMLLLMNAKNRGDIAQQKRYLDDLSRRPENAYNPVVLVESARYHVNRGEYRKALDEAVLAERHWARLPPDLVIAKKTEIYEVQASAAQGLFYRSEDDLNLLDAAVRGWQKYREYVASTSRADLVARADREIARLETTRKRLK